MISAYITLISLSTGILMGLAVLDEPWPSQLGMSLLRILALAGSCHALTSAYYALLLALTLHHLLLAYLPPQLPSQPGVAYLLTYSPAQPTH